MQTLSVKPADGRNYCTANEALADWKAGKEFQIVGNGPYCSIRDIAVMKRDGYDKVRIWTRSMVTVLTEIAL